jgi:hypothetical protein
MTLRPILLFFALLSFLGAAFLWFRTPPDANSIFRPSNGTVELSGSATSFRAPRGGEQRIRVVTASGADFFTDCLAIPAVCVDPTGTARTISATTYFLTPRVFWPVEVRENGQTIVSKEYSEQAYRLHTEQEATLYRLPLGLALALALFAVWFGKRPAFD